MSDRLVALVVGDVEGHDLEAARIMSRLRHTARAPRSRGAGAGQGARAPQPGGAVHPASRGAKPRLATALIGVLDTVSGVITFSSAGHPSPVRIERGRAVELMVPPGRRSASSAATTRTTSTSWTTACLVMFTDGLVERRGVFLDDRLALLEASLRAAPTMEPATRDSDFVIDAMTADERSSDDIVVLAARRTPAGRGRRAT